jgi:hypothetical protein
VWSKVRGGGSGGSKAGVELPVLQGSPPADQAPD